MVATDRSTYLMATACAALLAAAILLPRTFRDAGGGFAAATSAAILFMGLAAVAALASIALLVRTLRRRRALSLPAKIAGAIPAAAIVLGLATLWLSIRG
jgi:hypothetical protein